MASKVCGELICLRLRGAKERVEKRLGRSLGGKGPAGTRDSYSSWIGCGCYVLSWQNDAIMTEIVFNYAFPHPYGVVLQKSLDCATLAPETSSSSANLNCV
jgi:hypothetical protein